MTKKITDPSLVSIRDLTEEDVPTLLNYWYRSPPGYFENLGVDPKKMQTEAEMEASIRKRLPENRLLEKSKLGVVAILLENKLVGIHSLVPLVENDHAVFHAHIFKPELRGAGIGMISYPKACKLFIERFNLKRMLFKTPIKNSAAIRVKEKLGIRQIGEEVINFSVIRENTLSKVFELTYEEILKRWPWA